MRYKRNNWAFEQLTQDEKKTIIKAIIETVSNYMSEGYSYGYSVNMACKQSSFTTTVISQELQKDAGMRQIRDHYNKTKRDQRYGFYHGTLATQASLDAFYEADAREKK